MRRVAERRGRSNEGGSRRVGRPTANDRGHKVEKMVDGGTRGRGQGEWQRVDGNPALRESAAPLGACDWPRVAMVAGEASTKVQ